MACLHDPKAILKEENFLVYTMSVLNIWLLLMLLFVELFYF